MATRWLAERMVRSLTAAALVLAVGCGSSEEGSGGGAAGAAASGGGSGTSAGAASSGPPSLPTREAWCGTAPCPCTDGTRRNHGNGEIDKCTLAEARTIQGTPCAADKPLDFHENGTLSSCFLAEPLTLGPLPCGADDQILFRDSGLLTSCRVTEPVQISGLECHSLVSLHADGSLKYCTPTRDQQVGAHLVPAGNSFEMHPDGHLHRWELYQHTVTTGGMACKGTMMFYPDGTVAECRRLAEPYTAGEHSLAADERVCFGPQGGVIECSTSHQYIKAFPD
jgi:hypothetical protein